MNALMTGYVSGNRDGYTDGHDDGFRAGVEFASGRFGLR
jgi:hypothetical protein